MTRLATAEFQALVRATLHALSPDGEICSVQYYNENKPEILPKAGGVVTRLELSYWRQLATWAGLSMSGARAGNHRDMAPEPRHQRDPRSIVTAAYPQPNAATGLIRMYVRRGWR